MADPTDSDKIGFIDRQDRPDRPLLEFGLSFLDPNRGIQMAQQVTPRSDTAVTRLIIECPVMYESIRPFLESLKGTDPHRLPMSRYLITEQQQNEVALPGYSVKPGFKWDLSSLLSEKAQTGEVGMAPMSASSVSAARTTLKQHGKLDPR